MDWPNERYVRIYVRDTAEWLALSWQARALMWEILRKVDRSGVLTLGKRRAAALAGLVRWPLDVTESALGELISEERLAERGDAVVVPDHLAAQEARASDRLRQAESRARRRDLKLGGAEVTPRDGRSRLVTDGHETGQNVTSGHTESHVVTPSRAEPYRAEPSQSLLDADAPSGNAGTKPKRQRQTRELPPLPFTLAEIEAAFRETLEPERCQFGPFDPRLAKPLTATVRAFAAAGYGLADVRLVGEWVRGTWSPGIGVAWQSIATVGKLTGWAAKARSWRDTGARPRTVGDRPDEFGSFEYDVVGGGPS